MTYDLRVIFIFNDVTFYYQTLDDVLSVTATVVNVMLYIFCAMVLCACKFVLPAYCTILYLFYTPLHVSALNLVAP